MRLLVSGDWHLGAGSHLGALDDEFENTRLRDAEHILWAMLNEPHQAIVFLGDLAATAAPRPVVYRIAQRVLSGTEAPTFLMMGNHDWSGNREHIGLNVIAAGLDHVEVVARPAVKDLGWVQIGFLPWTPPTRLFDAARHDPRRMNAAVAERLVGAAHALARKIDPDRPSVLVLHWLLKEGRTTTIDVLELPEPLLPVDELQSGPWDMIFAGHNHLRQQVGERTWHVGAPLRTSWGEAEHEPGYVYYVVHQDGTGDTDLRWMGTGDARLVRLDYSFGPSERPWEPETPWEWGDVFGALVRVRIACSEEQAKALTASGTPEWLRGELLEAGARKVIGPQLVVERQRRVRSDLQVESDPLGALEKWMEIAEIETGLRPEVLKEAKAVMDA